MSPVRRGTHRYPAQLSGRTLCSSTPRDCASAARSRTTSSSTRPSGPRRQSRRRRVRPGLDARTDARPRPEDRQRRLGAGCPIIVAVKQWDLIEERRRTPRTGQRSGGAAPFLQFIPFLTFARPASGAKLLEPSWRSRTSAPNACHAESTACSTLLDRQRRRSGGESVRLLYASQIAPRRRGSPLCPMPPGDPGGVHAYLVNASGGVAVHRLPLNLKLRRRRRRPPKTLRLPSCWSGYLIGATPTSYIAAARKRHRLRDTARITSGDQRVPRARLGYHPVG